MFKSKNNKIVIKTGHTFSEYSKYFGRLYEKGKVLSYLETEKEYLNPKRQYWLIKDKKNGEVQYYELPYYINKNSQNIKKNPRRLIFHSIPGKTILMALSAVILAFGGIFAYSRISYLLKRQSFDEQVDLLDYNEAINVYKEWRNIHSDDDDASDINNGGFAPFQLAQIAMANSLYDVDNPISINGDGPHYSRIPLLVVSYGSVNPPIMTKDSQVFNATITDGTKMLEESFTYEGARSGKRDYYDSTTDQTLCTQCNRDSKGMVSDWNNDTGLETFNTKQDYQKVAGKDPFDPFLYDIAYESVVEGDESFLTNAKKEGNGYTIHLNLHTNKGVTRYVRRIAFMSPYYYLPSVTVSIMFFNYIHLTFKTDNNLRLISTSVDESYRVALNGQDTIEDTIGNLAGTFYYSDVPEIPDRNTIFDYSKYPASIEVK